MPTPEAAHRATQEALLDVESKALSALRATASQRASFRDPLTAAREQAARVTPIVTLIRQAARRTAASRMQIEVTGFKALGAPDIELPRLLAPAAADALAAERATQAYYDALLQDAQRILANAEHAAKTADKRLEAIAATEVPDAFNDERIRIEKATRQRYDGTDWFPYMTKQWDALLDACPKCKKLDGKSRVWGFEFAGGLEPGRAHRRCRCTSMYVFAPLYAGRSAAA